MRAKIQIRKHVKACPGGSCYLPLGVYTEVLSPNQNVTLFGIRVVEIVVSLAEAIKGAPVGCCGNYLNLSLE